MNIYILQVRGLGVDNSFKPGLDLCITILSVKLFNKDLTYNKANFIIYIKFMKI